VIFRGAAWEGRTVHQNDCYRRYAREALNLARKSGSETEKASWLRVAQAWLDLESLFLFRVQALRSRSEGREEKRLEV
jgi:hypothetical protein